MRYNTRLLVAIILTGCVSNSTDAVAQTESIPETIPEDISNADANTAGNTLPDFVYDLPEFADESDAGVRSLIKSAAKLVHPEPRQARKNYVKALSLVKSGKDISEYDYFWTRYGLLKSSHETNTADFGPGTQADYIKLAKQTLDALSKHVTIMHYSELGAFKRENYRVAGNGLAWEQMKLAQSEQDLLTALDNVEYAIEHIESSEHYYIVDTKVRILLKLNRKDEAFALVKKILDEVPDFGDFQDLKTNPDYLAWLKTHS